MAEASPTSHEEGFVLLGSDVYEYTVSEACRFSRQISTPIRRSRVVRQGDKMAGPLHTRPLILRRALAGTNVS
jgi:hypothetical protein